MTEENIQAQAAEEVGTEISSEEELLAIINGNEGNSDEPDKKTDEPDKKVDEPANGLPSLTDEPDKKGDDPDKKDDAPDKKDEEEYNNMVEYINNRYDLKLNVDQLPKDMTREQEADLVGNLYDKVVQSANSKLEEYQRIDKVLEDKEVANFIKAKEAGKTMKDFASEYAGTSAGKSDEEVVKDKLKIQFPTMDDNDIQDMFEKLGDEKVTKLATEARKKDAADEEVKLKQKEKQEKKQAEQDDLDRAEDVKAYKSYVGKVSNVNGVPLDNKMKQELVMAATQPDKDGLTYLERALQSDLGVIRATLGLLHLEKLMSAGSTTNKNKIRNDLMEKLTANPEELQSSQKVETTEEFDATAANSF